MIIPLQLKSNESASSKFILGGNRWSAMDSYSRQSLKWNCSCYPFKRHHIGLIHSSAGFMRFFITLCIKCCDFSVLECAIDFKFPVCVIMKYLHELATNNSTAISQQSLKCDVMLHTELYLFRLFGFLFYVKASAHLFKLPCTTRN